MERLTIAELISHSDRQINRYPKNSQFYKEHEAVKHYLKKLKHFEDLQEKQQLVELPCPIGSIVWQLDNIQEHYAEEAKWKAYHVEFEFDMLSEWNKTIFATKEEAINKLKLLEE